MPTGDVTPTEARADGLRGVVPDDGAPRRKSDDVSAASRRRFGR
jgi:hypothetical protein